eukprot:s3841_g9.t1
MAVCSTFEGQEAPAAPAAIEEALHAESGSSLSASRLRLTQVSEVAQTFSDVDSEDMRAPLPEGLDDAEGLADDGYELLDQPLDDVDVSSVAPSTIWDPSLHEDSFTSADVANLNRMIDEAVAATPHVLSTVMPWELPGIRLVIGDDEPLVPVPVLEPSAPPDPNEPQTMEAPRTRIDRIRGSYHEIIDFGLTLNDSEIADAQWSRALERWYIVFSSGRASWPSGHDVQEIVDHKAAGGLRQVFGHRSANTVLKRANSIIRFMHWYRVNCYSVTPFPIQHIDVECYLESLQDSSASPSTFTSFLEAVRFCEKVLDIKSAGEKSAISAKVTSMCELASSRRTEKKQARVLTVSEVRFLENFIRDERNQLIDRYASCCFLFAVYSRSRWSDIRPLEGVHNSPLLPAPTAEGQWSDRAVNTVEAKRWLLSILAKFSDGVPLQTTIHCLKSTPLSWCSKAGVTSEVRQVLGHHVTGKKSHEIYSRDLLANPLRQFEDILKQVRTGSFRPDASRSGMISMAASADPRESFVQPTEGAEAENEPLEPSSSDSSDDSSSTCSFEEDHLPEIEAPLAKPQVWNPDFDMYRHRRTQTVHLMAEGSTHNTFSCGLKCSSDHELVKASAFLEFRKCKRCEVAKPIRDVGSFASALKKRRLESEEKAPTA